MIRTSIPTTLAMTVFLTTGAVTAQEQTWDPDHFNPGAAPTVALPRTPGVPVNSGFNDNFSQPSTSVKPVTEPFQYPSREITSNVDPVSPPEATLEAVEEPDEVTTGETTTNAPTPVKTANKPIVRDRTYVAGMVLSGVASVSDGHSLLVGGHPVRLNGIEAPSLTQTCNTSTMTVWACGTKAANRLTQLIGSNKVTCIVSDQAGHGAAAVCSTRDIQDLGKMLVAEGLALPNSHGKRYQQDTLNAQQSRKGLFTGTFVHPLRWRSLNP